jgi:hypothetical protein
VREEIANKWTAALCSGEYKQGSFTLRDRKNRFCCLGVLTDLYIKENGREWDGEQFRDHYAFNGFGAVLSNAVLAWAGMRGESGERYDKNLPSLSELNDRGISFNRIAELIQNEKDTL